MGIVTPVSYRVVDGTAEYTAACEACMKVQGLRNIPTEVFLALKVSSTLGIDNQAA